MVNTSTKNQQSIDFSKVTDNDLFNYPDEQVFEYMDRHIESIKTFHITHLSYNDVIVLCTVRNGEYYIRDFINYYFTIGVKHIVFIDNNSTDNTSKIALEHENVSVYFSKLPFKVFRHFFKRYLLNKYGAGKWSLVLDIDEYFDFPLSEYLSLKEFIAYLNQENYDAVVTPMLDMFPDEELSKNDIPVVCDFRSKHIFYELHSVKKENYLFPKNIISNPLIKKYMNGVRLANFNLDRVTLMKQALIFNGGIKNSIKCHTVENSKLADISCVLFHYKFYGDFYQLFKDAAEKEYYSDNSKQYKHYLSKFENQLKVSLFGRGSIKYDGTSSLIRQEFIVVTRKYLNWVANQFRNSNQDALQVGIGISFKEKKFNDDLESTKLAIESLESKEIHAMKEDMINVKKKAYNISNKSFFKRIKNTAQSILRLFNFS